jgi:hypothetical protein
VVKVAPRYLCESTATVRPDHISAEQSHVALRVAAFTSEESNHV